MNITLEQIASSIPPLVAFALAEDIGSGDISAELIPSSAWATASIITRQDCILCGQAYVNEVFKQLGQVTINWRVNEGEHVSANSCLVELEGPARILLTGERCALNFLQTLSATATTTAHYLQLIKGAHFRLLDTRKTIPGLRLAQKYAVAIGGGNNHRIGLYDAFLIKENHIAACSGIRQAIIQARKIAPGKPIEVEVETLEQLQEAIENTADRVMLDNFTAENIAKAIAIAEGRCELEVSGNLDLSNLAQLKTLNVDYISSGALTKHIQAIDLSMRLTLETKS